MNGEPHRDHNQRRSAGSMQSPRRPSRRSATLHSDPDRGILKLAMRSRTSTYLASLFVFCAVVAIAAIAAPEDASPADAGAEADGGLGPDLVDAEDAGADGDADRTADARNGADGGDFSRSSLGDADTDPDSEGAVEEGGEPVLEEPEAMSEEDLPDDRAWIFVDKSERRMVVHMAHGYHESFRVALGPEPVGDKELEGDGRTPEGEFYVCHRIRHDRFHRFLGLSYPGPEDAQRGEALGLLMPIEIRAIHRAFRQRGMPPWRTALGGNVGIHGYGRRQDRARRHTAGEDWTDGCVAVTNEEIERIYAHVRVGTRVVIVR